MVCGLRGQLGACMPRYRTRLRHSKGMPRQPTHAEATQTRTRSRQLSQEPGNHHKPSQANLEIQGIQIARPPAALRACWGGRRSIMMLRHIRLGIKSTWLGSGGRLLRGARNKLAPRLPRRQAPWKVGMHVSHASSQSCPVKFPCVGRVA